MKFAVELDTEVSSFGRGSLRVTVMDLFRGLSLSGGMRWQRMRGSREDLFGSLFGAIGGSIDWEKVLIW